MHELISAALAGGTATLVLIYWAARRHHSHTGRTTGPNSRVPVTETIIPVVKKG